MNKILQEEGKSLNMPISTPISKLTTSATLAAKINVDYLRSLGETIMNFGLGESPFGAPKSVEEALKRHASNTSYLPTQGLPKLREEITGFYKRYFDITTKPDNVIIAPGSKQLLYETMVILDADWFFISPSWVSYETQAKIVGRSYWKAYLSDKNGYKVTEKQLRKRFNDIVDELNGRSLAMLINYPNNPTGMTLDKNEVQRIARFARNNEIIILSDEIYANVTHPNFNQKHHSFALEYPEGTITTGGISKDRSMGGWRLGVAILPDAFPLLRKAYKAVGSETYSCVSAPIQHAAIVAYQKNDDVEQHMKYSTLVHQTVGTFVYEQLHKAGFNVNRPEGAFYLLPSLNFMEDKLAEIGIYSSKDLTDYLLLEYGIAVIPGTAFGLRSDDLAFRMAYIDYDGPAALKTMIDNPELSNDPEYFVRNYTPKVYTGMEKFAEFMSKF